MSFISGLGYGLATLILIGPVFFTLLEAAITRGFKAGAIVALGILIGDLIYVILCYYGLNELINSWLNETQMAWIGAAILFGLGLKYLIGVPPNSMKRKELNTTQGLGLFGVGFAVNFVNPFVLAIWLAFVQLSRTSHAGSEWIFLAGILTAIFVTDLLKAKLAPALGKYLTERKITLFYKAIGIIMLLFSVRLMWAGFHS